MKNASYVDKCLIAGGLVGAEFVTKCVLNSKPVLVGKREFHLHHWMIGAGMGIAGLFAKGLKNDIAKMAGSIVAGVGAGIFLHDAKDFAKCIKL